MEKISIARRRIEKQNIPLSISKTINTHSMNSPLKANTLKLTPNSLVSLITEETHLVQTGKREFTIEIVSGLKNPFKMLVSLQPLNSPCVNNKNFLTTQEASQRLRVSKNTIYRQLKSGNLLGHKIGRQWRVPLNSLNLIENHMRRDKKCITNIGE